MTCDPSDGRSTDRESTTLEVYTPDLSQFVFKSMVFFHVNVEEKMLPQAT